MKKPLGYLLLNPWDSVFRKKLSIRDIVKLLMDYANTTGKYFCRRCDICDTTNADGIPIFNIMEMFMYSRGYGITDLVAQWFARLPNEIKSKIASSDYSGAEIICYC